MHKTRIIGRYIGTEPGPLFICVGAMHGNEPAGVQAIDLVLKMLEVEPIRSPDFVYRGQLLGLIGNLRAFNKGMRFIDHDLNRSLCKEQLLAITAQAPEKRTSEEQEFLELVALIQEEIEKYKPTKVIFLDLHTTSSNGGIFSICRDIDEDIQLTSALLAPIVLGIINDLRGTTLHYFITENIGVKTIPITFESGQHEEKMAVNRAVAGIIKLMNAIEAVDPDVIENHHEQILISYAKDLPQVTRLVKRHGIAEGDGFEMAAGFSNFQEVEAGEEVARDKNGPIIVQESARILMPLYQKQGEDGFFLVKE